SLLTKRGRRTTKPATSLSRRSLSKLCIDDRDTSQIASALLGSVPGTELVVFDFENAFGQLPSDLPLPRVARGLGWRAASRIFRAIRILKPRYLPAMRLLLAIRLFPEWLRDESAMHLWGVNRVPSVHIWLRSFTFRSAKRSSPMFTIPWLA